MKIDSSIKHWIEAARPQTLPAALTPIVTAAGIAHYLDAFSWVPVIIALLSASLIQIGTNFANDYYDYKRGADTEDRVGFERPTSTGAISEKQMYRATWMSMAFAFLTGLVLVWIGGPIILLIGLLSLLFGVLYTGGPFPLAYNGLGDLFVFLFFGVIAVTTTVYLQTLEWIPLSFIISIGVGTLCVNILVINNLRDIVQDTKVNKRTLGVLFGERFLKWEYTLMLVIACLIPIWVRVTWIPSNWIILPNIILPFAILPLRTVWVHEEKSILNQTLKQTALMMFGYGVLFTIGLSLS